MTTHDQHTDLSDSTHEVQPMTPGGAPATGHTAAPVSAEPPTSPTATQPTHNDPPGPGSAHDPGLASVTTSEPVIIEDSGAPATQSQHRVGEPNEVSQDPATGRALFADDELAGLRARWDSVQAGFVDDPKECVHKADGLVSDLVDQLTAGFADARSRLEEQWARGEQASTEDLRVALQHYREFFQRLLAV